MEITMKCIKLNDGTVKRIKDKDAEKLVDEGKASYTSKESWKLFTGRWPKEEQE
jgi:hypothetical protein